MLTEPVTERRSQEGLGLLYILQTFKMITDDFYNQIIREKEKEHTHTHTYTHPKLCSGADLVVLSVVTREITCSRFSIIGNWD